MPNNSHVIPELTDSQKQDYLNKTLIRDDPPDQVFEIGLVLGGTVSAGAYTAGALDLLFQAGDAWHEQNDPPHKIMLSVAAGSSGGAVCAALLSILANRQFTHVSESQATLVSPPPSIDNKLWNVWVDNFHFDTMIATSDLKQLIDEGVGDPSKNTQRVASVFNCQMIDDAVSDIVAYAGQYPTKDREWIGKPFRVAITVGNLRGIPYKIQNIHPAATQYTGAAYIQHDDFAWFAVPSWVTPPANLRAILPDEFWVADSNVGYGKLAQWARASGAMPVALKARLLSRPAVHYCYRPRVRVKQALDGTCVLLHDWPTPDWKEFVDSDGTCSFTAVDGGTFNNDPVNLAHTALAGLVGFNPQKAHEAKRAIFMIDPLADEPASLDKVDLSLVAVVKSMVGDFVDGARYLTADMELFADKDVFSRFQLVPYRKDQTMDGIKERVGSAALAGTGLFAMAGWCKRDFRVHDYLLGRTNMLAYLKSKFILRADNPLFDKWFVGTASFFASGGSKFAVDENGSPVNVDVNTPRIDYFLPIIPVMESISAPIPDQPSNVLDPDSLKDGLKERLDAVLETLREDNLEKLGMGWFDGLGGWFIDEIGVPRIADIIAEKIIQSLKDDLQSKGLWTKQ